MRPLAEREIETVLQYWDEGKDPDILQKVVYIAYARNRVEMEDLYIDCMDVVDEMTVGMLLACPDAKVDVQSLNNLTFIKKIKNIIPREMIEKSLRIVAPTSI